MAYDEELDTLINRKTVRARPGLRDFLREMLGLFHVVVWSAMVMDNTESIVDRLFRELLSPCLVLGQEASDELVDERGLPVLKFGGRGGEQHVSTKLHSHLSYLKLNQKNLIKLGKIRQTYGEKEELWVHA